MKIFFWFFIFLLCLLQKILTHSKSRVVLQAMKEAVESNKIFEVYVTCSSPDNSG